MAADNITEMIDTLYTTTWANRRADVADNIFDATPFYFWLKDKGGFKQETGGRRLEVSLRYGKSPNIGWIRKGSTVPMNDMDHLTTAYYDWKYLTDSIVRFLVDDQQNAGKSKIIDLMNSKIDNSMDSLVEELEKRLFGKAADGDDYMLGLQDIVADNPTGGTPDKLGGIDQSDQSWWRNQYKNANSESFATQGFKNMQKMLNDCMNNKGKDRPDIIVSGQTAWEYYDDEVRDERRIVNQKLGDMGFENVQFKGLPMIWSSYCDNGRMYFLNTRFLQFCYDPRYFMDMTAWKEIPNQPGDRAAQIVTAGNLVTNRRRCHGIIYNINTA